MDRSEQPPENPRDWKQKVTIRCSCEDCRALKAFARKPEEQTHRFPVRKARRRHLHETIRRHELDMTHVTERKGSPHTLVCTKTRRGYERRLNQYRSDLAAMAVLLRFPVPKSARVLAKLTAAVVGGKEAS